MQKIEAIKCFSNISLQEHFRVTAAKPLKQLYYPLIWGTKKVNKTHLILAGDLRKLIKKLKNGIFVSKWIIQVRDFILINQKKVIFLLNALLRNVVKWSDTL